MPSHLGDSYNFTYLTIASKTLQSKLNRHLRNQICIRHIVQLVILLHKKLKCKQTVPDFL